MNSHSPQSRDRFTAGSGASAAHPAPRRFTWTLLLLPFALLLGACATTTAPVKTVSKGDEIVYYDFSQAGTFEEASYDEGRVRLEIRDGSYHMDLLQGDSVLWYGQWGDTLHDEVIDVDAKQTTDSQNTTYGVMCRARGTVGQLPSKPDADLAALAGESNSDLIASDAAEALEATLIPKAEATFEVTLGAGSEATTEATSEATSEATAEATTEATTEATAEPTAEATSETTSEATVLDNNNVNNGDGYLFLIEGTGRFAILRSSGRSTTPLVDWTASAAIKTGAAENHIRAICTGNYLALYINGEFMADASDDTYNKGQIGLAVAAANRLGNQVSFDNLTISEAKSGS